MSEEEEKKAIEYLKQERVFAHKFDKRQIITIITIALKLIRNQQKELNTLKEIEQLHQEENGKLRVELEQYKRLAEMNLKDAEEFQNNMCEHRCILYNEIEELRADLFEEKEKYKRLQNTEAFQENYISKEKIKEKMEELEMEYKKPYNDYEKLSFAIDILKDLLED